MIHICLKTKLFFPKKTQCFVPKNHQACDCTVWKNIFGLTVWYTSLMRGIFLVHQQDGHPTTWKWVTGLITSKRGVMGTYFYLLREWFSTWSFPHPYVQEPVAGCPRTSMTSWSSTTTRVHMAKPDQVPSSCRFDKVFNDTANGRNPAPPGMYKTL